MTPKTDDPIQRFTLITTGEIFVVEFFPFSP
jgi:hypothetical protein